MKKTSLVLLVSFLMILYIGPSILAPSLMRAPILTEPNMTKDFSIADGEAWLDGWYYRRNVTFITNMGANSTAGTNYQFLVEVTYDSHMQTDFDDIRFTDNDGETLLDHYRESYTPSTTADFWVEIKDNSDKYCNFYMYHGNATATSASNGEATFLFFDDFEDNNLDNWVDTSNMEISSDRTRDTYSASWTVSGSNAVMQYNAFDGLSGISFSFWNNIQDSLRGSFVYIYSEADYSEYVATVRATYETDTSEIYYRDTGVYVVWPDSADDLNDDEWDKIELSVDFDENEMQTSQNDVTNGILAIVEDDGTALETQEIDGIGLMMQSDKQIWFDDVVVRKFVADAPEFLSFGAEEDSGDWQEVGVATLIFPVGWDPTFQFGYDAFFIFAGLIMIPLSTMYLVRGGRKGMSMDKLFFALLVFAIGLGLFIGGIMP